METMKEKLVEYTTSYYIFRNLKTKEETFIDSAESDKLSKTIDVEEVKGGVMNNTLFTISKNEKIDLEVVDVLTREELNRARWGAELKKGAIPVREVPFIYTAGDSEGKKVFELKSEPIDINSVKIFETKTKQLLAISTDYTITGKQVEITKSDVAVGDTFSVESYLYNSTAETEYYDVGVNSVPAVYDVTKMKPIYNTNDEIVYWRQTHMPKVQLDRSIEETGNTEKSKQTNTYKGSVQKGDNYPYTMRTIYVKA